MKAQIYQILIFTLVIIGFTACEKIITVKLNEADRKIVVEGYLSNDSLRNYIKLSKTGSYYETNNFDPISDAKVTIIDNSGNSYNTIETADGYYFNSLKPVGGTIYNLNIIAGANVVNAKVLYPSLVPIDSLSYLYHPEYGFFKEGYTVSLYYKDNGYEENYYRYKIYKNDSLQDILLYSDDQFNNGIAGRFDFWQNNFLLHDTVRVDLVAIDKSTYVYLKGVDELLNQQGNAAAPGNPTTNLNGSGAVGIFTAYNVDSKTIIIE